MLMDDVRDHFNIKAVPQNIGLQFLHFFFYTQAQPLKPVRIGLTSFVSAKILVESSRIPNIKTTPRYFLLRLPSVCRVTVWVLWQIGFLFRQSNEVSLLFSISNVMFHKVSFN